MMFHTVTFFRSRWNCVWQLARDLVRLVQSWWSVDRIRVSPVEGALLRMSVGTVIRVDGENWLIEKKWIGDGARGPLVQYECSNGIATAILITGPSPSRVQGKACWKSGSGSRELCQGEIEVYELAQ